MKEYLPIGTVLTLKGQEKPVVIVGFAVLKDGQYFDYCAFPYPEGYCGDDRNIVFERTMIEKIIHKGYEDLESKMFSHIVTTTLDKVAKEY